MNIVTKFSQSILVGMRMAVAEMQSHKLRSALSMLGVLLGVASLVAMLTLIGGVDVFIKDKMGKWAGMLWIWKKSAPTNIQEIQTSRSPGLRLSDGTFLSKNSQDIKTLYKSIQRQGKIIVAGGNEWTTIKGFNKEAFLENLTDVKVGQGKWLSDCDFRTGTKRCIVSWDLANSIAQLLQTSGRDPKEILDCDITFGQTRLRIVGTFKPKDKNIEPWQLRKSVVIPILTMQNCITGMDPDPGVINLLVSDPENIKIQSQRIANTLISKHRGVLDFEYKTADWSENFRTMLSNISLFMSIVSIISLVVGGLGIMNVMLSSISERLHEIGIRKALGAQNTQIFIQFITESITLCIIGGSTGAIFGCIPLLFSDSISKATDGSIVPTILPLHMMYAAIIIFFVGFLFGLYPALKATRLNPIEALRYE